MMRNNENSFESHQNHVAVQNVLLLCLAYSSFTTIFASSLFGVRLFHYKLFITNTVISANKGKGKAWCFPRCFQLGAECCNRFRVLIRLKGMLRNAQVLDSF